MKRRLLAIVLACVMVISMLPMNVFAAVQCPGADVLHNLTNCPDAVKGETVAPICGEYGYTLYECPSCGADFASDFVEPVGEHNWAVTTEKVEATCDKDGAEAVETCSVCKATKGGEVIPATGHDWEVVGTATEGCTVSYKCANCGEVKSESGDHDWCDMPEIVLEPTYFEDGLAKYTCEVCGKTKEVVILCEHVCSDFDVIEGKDATCEATGLVASKQCKECKTLFNMAGEEIETNVIEALGHNFDIEKGAVVLSQKDATCSKEGSRVVECANGCGKKETQVIEMAPHSYEPEPTFVQEATCTKYGYKLYACINCGHYEEVDRQDPLGCTLYDDELSTDKVEIAPTCTKDGSYNWNCGRCGEAQSETIAKLGCDVKTVTVEAKCHQFGYTFTYCANEGCDAEGVVYTETYEDVENAAKYREPEYAIYNVTVDGKAVNLLSIEIDVEGGMDANCHTRDNSLSYAINEPTCTKDGNGVFYCAYCSYYGTEVLKATGHNFDLENGATIVGIYQRQSCTKDEKITIKCANCSATKVVTTENVAYGHKMGEPTVVAPTCVSRGYTLRVCENGCGHSEKTDYVAIPAYKLEYTYEEASTIHNLDPNYCVEKRQGTCEIVGLYEYRCLNCRKDVLVVDDETGKGHVPGTVHIEPKDATCTEAGWTMGFTCKCGVVVESEEIPALGHKIGKPTCTEGVKCERCDYTEAATGHRLMVCTDHAEVSCLQFGYVHTECRACDYEVIRDYVPTLGHDMIVDEEASFDANCTEDGLKVENCGNGCGHTVETVLPATGHKNEAGEAIVDVCTDTVEDRFCVNCQSEIGKSHSAKYYEGDLHPSTCTEYGYIIHSCEICGQKDVEQIETLGEHSWIGKGLDGWTVTVAPTYHSEGTKVRECLVCGYTETESVPVKTGIGMFINVENALQPGAAIVDSSVVKVTVSVDANAVGVQAYAFTLNYNKYVLDFIGAEFGENVAFGVNTSVTDVHKANGEIVVAANSYNSDAGLTQDYIVDADEVLVDLYFRVNCAEEAETYLNIVNAKFINKTGADAAEIIETEQGLVAIDQFLDVDNDGEFTLVDCQIAYKILIGEPVDGVNLITYDATIDIDKDGFITIVDVQMLYDYLVGNNDYEDMTAAGIQ